MVLRPCVQLTTGEYNFKSMSAFANTLGGALIFGMADAEQIVGLTEPDSDAEKISEIIKTRMEPI